MFFFILRPIAAVKNYDGLIKEILWKFNPRPPKQMESSL